MSIRDPQPPLTPVTFNPPAVSSAIEYTRTQSQCGKVKEAIYRGEIPEWSANLAYSYVYINTSAEYKMAVSVASMYTLYLLLVTHPCNAIIAITFLQRCNNAYPVTQNHHVTPCNTAYPTNLNTPQHYNYPVTQQHCNTLQHCITLQTSTPCNTTTTL